jgi:preprotein translocase subunit SecD
LLDGVVESAPVIKAKVEGGHASITMGAGEPERQLEDARRVELTVRSGALPAPIALSNEELLGRDGG